MQMYLSLVLGLSKTPPAKNFFLTIAEKPSLYTLRISRAIVKEISSNLSLEDFRKFIRFINSLTTIDQDFLVPFELGAKYEAKGFKAADALIAAYTEWTGAEILVTENRHFLSRRKGLSFRILTAQNCCKLLSSS